MVSKVRITLTCDHDKCTTEEGVETRTLGLDGRSSEVDLCGRHYTELATRVEPLLKAGRSLKKRKSRSKAA